MMKIRWVLLAATWVACSNNNGNNGNNNKDGMNNQNQGNCSGSGCSGPSGNNKPGTLGIQGTADLSGAFGLLVLDNSQTASASLVDAHNSAIDQYDLPTSKMDSNSLSLSLVEDKSTVETSPMQKIDSSSGKIVDALTQTKRTTDNNSVFDPNQKLPKLRTIAISPTGEVYLQFENPFIYKDAIGTDDPWNMSNGFQCQIFKIIGGTLSDLRAQAPASQNLECVDNLHFAGGPQSFSNGFFQFDSDGRLYYPGSLPNGGGKSVLYRIDRDGKNRKEMINANICVQNYLVTKGGGIFYTGNTCSDQGGNPGGGGFFRYVAPGENGAIMEIARDWWNFIYDISVNTNQTDSAVFFGPDPREASTASWNSACLFQFDPSQTDPNSRISEVITCGNNIGDWMNLNRQVDKDTFKDGYNQGGNSSNHAPTIEWRKEFSHRCKSKDEVFAGGGSQISAIKQDSLGDIYVIGNIRKKEEGQVFCNVSVRGPHCTVSNIPVLKDSSGVDYTETTCQADAGTWVNKGQCSNQSTDASTCMNPDRHWNPGFCSNPDYQTQAACEAATGCSNRWFTDQTSCNNAGYIWHPGSGNGLVWRLGSCSTNQDAFETKDACEAANHVWTVDQWSGSCTSTDTADNASLYNNNKNSCVPQWSTDQVWYNNVTGDICTAVETGERASFWDWNNKNNHFDQTASSTALAYSDLAGKFLIEGMNCQKVSNSGNSWDWTTEYSALAKVDKDAKNLKLISLPTEKAISLWLVQDKPYFSSFDTSLGQYTLNGLNTDGICQNTELQTESDCTKVQDLTWVDRKCINATYTVQADCEAHSLTWKKESPYTLMTNFEAYHVANSAVATQVYADGLDFTDNQYKFGTIDLGTKKLELKDGLTGTLKTILILPSETK